jgi:uncharacterized membrane protein
LGQAILSGMGAPDLNSLLTESLQRRVSSVGGWVTMSILLGLILGLLFSKPKREKAKIDTQQQPRTFLIILIFVGLLLVLAPEFIYLRDQFSTRMNTVFKFYFQAWQMWAVAAAVIVVILLYELKNLGRILFVVLLTLLVGAGLVYPAFAFSDVARHTTLNMDGASHLSADTVAAIQWLQQAPLGNLVEAVGGSYDSNFARYSSQSGQPTLIGWPGHEGQWRNGNYDAGRIDAVQTLYTTADWSVAQGIIDAYEVKYIVVGEWERYKYNTDQIAINEDKFIENLTIAFQNPTVTIYEVP